MSRAPPGPKQRGLAAQVSRSLNYFSASLIYAQVRRRVVATSNTVDPLLQCGLRRLSARNPPPAAETMSALDVRVAVFGVTDLKCCAIRVSVLEWTLNNPQCAENITMILDVHHSNAIHLDFAKTNKRLNSIRFLGSRLWNNIPAKIKSASSVSLHSTKSQPSLIS